MNSEEVDKHIQAEGMTKDQTSIVGRAEKSTWMNWECQWRNERAGDRGALGSCVPWPRAGFPFTLIDDCWYQRLPSQVPETATAWRVAGSFWKLPRKRDKTLVSGAGRGSLETAVLHIALLFLTEAGVPVISQGRHHDTLRRDEAPLHGRLSSEPRAIRIPGV